MSQTRPFNSSPSADTCKDPCMTAKGLLNMQFGGTDSSPVPHSLRNACLLAKIIQRMEEFCCPMEDLMLISFVNRGVHEDPSSDCTEFEPRTYYTSWNNYVSLPPDYIYPKLAGLTVSEIV